VHVLDRRVQILLDEERYDRLAAEARKRNLSVAAVIREAIDKRFPSRSRERSRAARAILDAEPMLAPSLEELKAELDDLRSGNL
jgi:Ribbon-helix-helix protein, copG family